MKNIISKLGFLLFATSLVFTSCENPIQSDAEEVVEYDEHYQNIYDADNAIWGLYAQFAKLAENVVVLNELRADLMDITELSSPDLVALNDHTAGPENYYCDPTPFYNVILNANDIIANFNKMLADKRLSSTDYKPRYADVVAVRTWAYFQLAQHFSSVPYITDPITSVDDLSLASNAAKLGLDAMLIQLINDMEAVDLNPNILSTYYGKPITDNSKTFLIDMQMLNKRLLLGDLYLWNNQYVEAASQYKDYMDEDDASSSKTQINNKVSGWVWNATNEPRFQVTYARYKDRDENSYRNMWKEIFSRPSTDMGSSAVMGLTDEMITMISFSGTSNSTSPFIRLFANTGQGEYQIKPSSYAVDSLWETQVQQSNGFVFDGRGRESSFDEVNGQRVVLKYLYDYYSYSTDANRTIHLNYNNVDNPYTKPGKWFLYRAGLLHLRYAEAANRAGYPRLAYALLNNGIKANYDWRTSTGAYRADKEGVQYTSYPPLSDTVVAEAYPYPFYLDARQNDAPYTFLRSPWRDNTGVRGRAFLTYTVKPDSVITTQDSIQWLETEILKEAALECGFEGNRWGDLLRVNRRRAMVDGQGDVATLMSKSIENKFKAAGKTAPVFNNSNLFLQMKE